MNMNGDIRYYDVRHVKGQTTHIDIDNCGYRIGRDLFFQHCSNPGAGTFRLGNFDNR